MGGPLLEEEIIEVKKHGNIDNFVETGTYKGDTSIMASKYFKRVYTIEIYHNLYMHSMSKALNMGIYNINFYNGDSINILKNIVPTIMGGAVYFIDAHISGSDSSWNGKDRVPIYKELESIFTHKLKPSVFIVDDLRLWKNKVWDWAHITNEKLLDFIRQKGYKITKSYEKNDRFFIFIE